MNALKASFAFLLLLAAFAASADSKRVQGTVTAVSPAYGNIETSLTPDDLSPLGIKRGDSFRVGFGDKHFEVYLGDTYSDVPKGDWIAFMTPNGTLRIARNLDNAATTLGVKQGDTITLSH